MRIPDVSMAYPGVSVSDTLGIQIRDRFLRIRASQRLTIEVVQVQKLKYNPKKLYNMMEHHLLKNFQGLKAPKN